jgi:hypothetical protein
MQACMARSTQMQKAAAEQMIFGIGFMLLEI